MQQYENLKKNLNNIKQVIKEIKEGKVKVEDLYAPFAMGLLRRMHSDEKEEYLKAYENAVVSETIKINALVSQLQHKGDSLGEQRMRVFRILKTILMNQHDYSWNDLEGILTNKSLRNTGMKIDETMEKIQDVMEQVKQ